ncbi:MAG TPA: sensor histidine kinase [Candidatus Competibacteraceae bacterium]|nr:sensor histidine kinase [Candidatus Competibacteraceae bacterium]MCP5133931.1 sensor histidine kinase [Gammaproteobacteria bacterium]HPF58358.1 sensor histidine kinase [Candidatus Competibacteraceae bacterium]HRY18424.1 sensor histidine kinase [Candidatus Competibacteraceae bacterium]
MTSLQTRLSAGLIVTLAVLILSVVAIGGYSLRQLAEDFVAARLEHDLQTLLAALEFDAAGQPRLPADRVSASFHQPYSGHYYQIEIPGGELCSRSLWDMDLKLPPLATDRFTRTFVTGPQNQQLLLVGRAFRVEDRPVAIAVTEDFAPVRQGIDRLLLEFIGIALLLFGVLLWCQRLLVRRGLAPLEEVRRELPRLAHGEIAQLSIDTPDEVRPLVIELNRLLALLDQRQRRARHALGNLAHALKTPLTALIQLTGQRPPPLDSSEWDDLRQQIRQIHALTERELKRARIAGSGAPGRRVLLEGEITDLVETLRRIYRDRDIQFDIQILPGSGFSGDRDDLLELLGNLLDNACQWAECTVRLTAGASAQDIWLKVEDDGPGCPPEQLALLQQRGARIDESRAGHGLGLAIAGDIVEQYRGVLKLGRSEVLGGFLAEVMLPSP